MKKLLAMLVVGLSAVVGAATYTTVEYTPDTNNVVTITGTLTQGMRPVVVMQEITGTTTNTVSSTFNPYTVSDSTNAYRMASMPAVVGGAEVPLVLTAGSNAPVIIKKNDVWTLTGSGASYSNIVISIMYEFN
jgi:hypothetical protein